MNNIEFDYIDLNDREICVNGIKTEEVPEELKVLEIPGEIDGKKVTSIASGNFNLRGLFIEEIVIPDTVERIEEFAFAYMVSLHEITIPDSAPFMQAETSAIVQTAMVFMKMTIFPRAVNI